MKRYLPAIVLVLFVIALAPAASAAEHTKDSLATVKKNLKEKKAVLFDVREQREWDAGHLQQALLVPLSKLLLRARYDTLAAIRCVQSPVLVFHGEIDEVVPFQLGREVYEAAPGPKEWRPIPGASHNDTHTVAGSAYFEAIKEFLAKYAE